MFLTSGKHLSAKYVLVLDAKDILIEKGRTTHGAPLLDNADLPRTDRQLFEANVIDKDSP